MCASRLSTAPTGSLFATRCAAHCVGRGLAPSATGRACGYRENLNGRTLAGQRIGTLLFAGPAEKCSRRR